MNDISFTASEQVGTGWNGQNPPSTQAYMQPSYSEYLQGLPFKLEAGAISSNHQQVIIKLIQ